MATLSTPLTPQLEEFVASYVKRGRAANKAEVVRKALTLLADEEAILDILQAEREIKAGKTLRGDLRVLAKKFAKHG